MNYGTIAEFRQYHEWRGVVIDPAVSDATITAALLVASEWIDNKYRALFDGKKIGLREQVREWPRASATDYYGDAVLSSSVPPEIENATYEAALIQLNAPGTLSVSFTPNAYRSVSIDGALKVEYNSYSDASQIQTEYKRIDEILSLLVGRAKGGSGNVHSGGAFRA